MQSLFLKIFLWFWLAMALMVAALILATMTVDSSDRRFRTSFGRMISVQALSAVETYERSGAAGLTGFLERVNKISGLRGYFYDRDGVLVSGIGADSPEKSGLAQQVKTQRRVQVETLEMVMLVATPIFDSKGTLFVYIEEIPRPPFNPWLGNPEVLSVRILAVLVTGSLVCYGLARYLANPIEKLRLVTQQFAGGELTVRVSPAIGRRRDEIGQLAHDFDRMAERIEGLVNAQRRLLSDISHELRSPLARLYVALGLARRRSGPDAKAALDRIEHETERLNELIGQLLTLTKLEGHSPLADAETFDLGRLVQEVAADVDFEAQAINRGVSVEAVHSCRLTGSYELVRRAIENVLRNAISYTPEQSEVKVSLETFSGGGNQLARITVRDYGPGVPEAELNRIFQPFTRVGDDRDRKTGGIGLGLAITERAVKAHGGTVQAANLPDGFEVALTLPLSEQQI